MPRRILLVEDNPDDARQARAALVEAGFSVQHCPTLAAARAAGRADAGFGLVLLDHELPDGDGPSIIADLRAAGVSAPVVLVTGNRSDKVAQRAFELGCVDTAVKDLQYHQWLPRMAEAFMAPGPGGGDLRWAPHVRAVSVGRVHGQVHRRIPEDAWPAFAPVLASASEMAIRMLRATRQSTLGALPMVHVQANDSTHLVYVLRAGVYAAALLDKAPTQADREALVAEAALFAKSREGAGTGGIGS